jgi:flagellar hook-associated protein 1 FlgK
MPGIFSTFNILRRAMSAQQYAVDTTSHNIANANTEGYSRQRATMEASKPQGSITFNSASGPGQLGAGVEISEITRARDLFLDVQIRNEMSTSGRFKARDEFLSEVEIIFMEPSDKGLSSNMGKMWDAWSELAKNPENSNARTDVAQASLTLADSLNHTYDQLDKLESHADELIQGQVFDFNSLISQIEDLNRQIQGVRITGSNPNDLMDKQDIFIDKLSEMANIRVQRTSLGEAIITANGTNVTGSSSQNLSYIKSFEKKADGSYTMSYYDKGDASSFKMKNISAEEYQMLRDSKIIWTDGRGNISKASLESGSIKGYMSIYGEIDEYRNQLDAMARGIAYAVNTVHNGGHRTDEYVNNDIAFFVASGNPGDESAITAGNITVNPTIISDPSKIHANTVYNNVDPSTNDPIGNGDRALAISKLRDSRIYMNEFLYNKSTVVSGVITENPAQALGFEGELVLSSGGITGSINVSAGDSLIDIAAEINAIDDGKTLDSQKLFLNATVDNGRLIIQGMREENNYVDIQNGGSNTSDLLDSLKILGKEGPNYWLDVRNNNSIVDGYDPVTMEIKDDPKGTTLESFFKDTISKLGSSARQAKSMVAGQEALIGQLDARKESISGVSIDEEVANLVQYQRAYQAAAKAVSVVDEMLDTLVNGMFR